MELSQTFTHITKRFNCNTLYHSLHIYYFNVSPSLLNHNLTFLNTLNLSLDPLTCTFPSSENYKNLVSLDLRNNKCTRFESEFSGDIKDIFGTQLTNLTVSDISSNMIDSSIPENLLNGSNNGTYFNLYENDLLFNLPLNSIIYQRYFDYIWSIISNLFNWPLPKYASNDKKSLQFVTVNTDYEMLQYLCLPLLSGIIPLIFYSILQCISRKRSGALQLLFTKTNHKSLSPRSLYHRHSFISSNNAHVALVLNNNNRSGNGNSDNGVSSDNNDNSAYNSSNNADSEMANDEKLNDHTNTASQVLSYSHAA